MEAPEDGALTGAERQNAARHKEAWQARQRSLIKEASAEHGQVLHRQYSREQIGGGTKPANILSEMEKRVTVASDNVIILTNENVAKMTSTGIEITQVTSHAQTRAAGRHISPATVNEVLTSPAAKVVRASVPGRSSVNYTLGEITVCVNSDTGKIITIMEKRDG